MDYSLIHFWSIKSISRIKLKNNEGVQKINLECKRNRKRVHKIFCGSVLSGNCFE